MEIVIIGTGNTATILGRMLKGAGHNILQIYGRNAKDASELAYELNTESTNYWSVVNPSADLYLIAVSDIAVEEVVKEVHLPDSTVVHTAASISKNILKDSSSHYGVFYPLQSLRKETTYLPDVPIIIDASDENTLQQLEGLAYSLSGTVIEAGDEERVKLHLAAVFCNNFVNHIYKITEQYCLDEGLDFKLLLPLIKETALRLDDLSPANAQTGPAIRNDDNTIQKHIDLLESHPAMQKLYTFLTQSIRGQSL